MWKRKRESMVQIYFFYHFSKVIGNERNTLFWHEPMDRSCGVEEE